MHLCIQFHPLFHTLSSVFFFLTIVSIDMENSVIFYAFGARAVDLSIVRNLDGSN